MQSCCCNGPAARLRGRLISPHTSSTSSAKQAGVYLVDGSGLSYQDRVSPSAFVSYLAKFPATAAGQNFPQLLPANGTGTLRRLNSGFPGEGVVRAKTGTLSRVSTLVGYLGRPEGTLVVSLMYNGSRPGAARSAQWKLFRLLGANGVVIPADTSMIEPPQLGSDETTAPDWWPQGGNRSRILPQPIRRYQSKTSRVDMRNGPANRWAVSLCRAINCSVRQTGWPTLDGPQQDDAHRGHQQDVDEPAEGIRRDDTE